VTSDQLCAANSVALDRVLFQCNPIGRRDQALRWQNTGGRAAGNSSLADKFGNRRFSLIGGGVLSCTDLNFGAPM